MIEVLFILEWAVYLQVVDKRYITSYENKPGQIYRKVYSWLLRAFTHTHIYVYIYIYILYIYIYLRYVLNGKGIHPCPDHDLH